MNYSKLILVGFISAFVALLTSVLGVAGTVIGSVISSVLYNMLSEALEKPVTNASFKRSNFEWDIAYVFPLIVIALIQLMLICALLSEWGILPSIFVNAYLSLQYVAANNLYRILGFALIIMSIYPFVLKPENVNKIQGGVIAFIGLIFLARGFVDLKNTFTDMYDGLFINFDLEIAIVTFILLAIVIVRILLAAKKSREEANKINNSKVVKPAKVHHSYGQEKFEHRKQVNHTPDKKSSKYSFRKKVQYNDVKKESGDVATQPKMKTDSNNEVNEESHSSRINKSSKNIQFESNDLLDEYKK